MSTVNKSSISSLAGAAPLGNGSSDERDAPAGALTRQDIALAIYNRLGGVSRREAKRIVDTVIDEMVSTLTSGESLKLHDFGSFIVREKHERAGRNPRTGAPVPIQARRVVVFKASPNMKASINGEALSQRGAKAAARHLSNSQKNKPLELDALSD